MVGRRKKGSTHCRSGRHEWTDFNTYVDWKGFIGCRICRNERRRNRWKNRKVVARSVPATA